MNKKYIYIFMCMGVLVGCKTVDLEKNRFDVLQQENQQLENENASLESTVEELYQYNVETDEYSFDIDPILIPFKETIVVNENDYNMKQEQENNTDLNAIQNSIEDSVVTLKDLNGGMSIYDYDENRQIPIWTKQLAMTTIILEAGEEVMTTPYLSDTIRWEISGDLWIKDGKDVQLIMIKPLDPGLETNMLVITSKRLYNFVLYSTTEDYQPMVTFRYPQSKEFITAQTKREEVQIDRSITKVNEDFLSFNYRIRYLWKVDWIPTLIYDDGAKTYIELPEGVLQKEMPVVHENKEDILNYRVDHNIIIIDKLIEKVKISIGNRSVTVEKKKGEAFINEK